MCFGFVYVCVCVCYLECGFVVQEVVAAQLAVVVCVEIVCW